MKIIALNYEQQRLEYFKQCKAECERKLEWYKNRKTAKSIDECMLHEKLSDYGAKICFYTDAIKAFGGDPDV